MRNDIIAIVCPDIHGRDFWERIAEEYYTAEAYEELCEENERLRAELVQRPPKLIITKLPKKENKNV